MGRPSRPTGAVKSVVGSPVAESFNLNFAVLYDQIAAQ